MTRLIAYMPTPGGLTGAPRRLLTLASVLRERGIDVCIASETGTDLLRAAENAGHQTVSVDTPGVLGLRRGALWGKGLWFRFRVLADLLRLNRRLSRCIRDKRSDVVWIRGSKGIAFGAFGVLLSRRVLIWDVAYESGPSVGMVHWLQRLGLWAAHTVVFQYRAGASSAFGQKLAMRYRHKVRAILPGIELSKLEPFRQRRYGKTRSASKSFVILQVGTISHRKNQEVSIEALRVLAEKELDVRWELWLVYDEVQHAELVRRIQDYGLNENVRLLGWRDDVNELMVSADILVMPSRDEGVPNAVQEAMAIGVPVLVSKAGGMPEIVSDGNTGWILENDNPDEWAYRIRWCQQNPVECNGIGVNAADYASSAFDTELWGSEYASVIEEATGSSRPMGGY